MSEVTLVLRPVVSLIDDNYDKVLSAESHHDHGIVKINGVLRWKEDPDIRRQIGVSNLNDVVLALQIDLDLDKNSEVYRKLYRDMGYSISGYWEVFYWEFNNEFSEDYVASELTQSDYDKAINRVKDILK